MTDKANTALAFVSLEADGNRTFSFYRKPSADLLYAPEQVDTSLFANAYALHFCSVALVESPMREAHKNAIAAARSAGTIIDFDPNLRFPLWPDRDALRRTVLEFLPLADVVKISDEELEFLTGTSDIEAALPSLFVGHVQLVLYTCGSAGAHAYTVDTTGAGDGFIGSFLWQLHKNGVDRAALPALQADQLNQWLDFSNRFCGYSVQRYGAIDSYPTINQL